MDASAFYREYPRYQSLRRIVTDSVIESVLVPTLPAFETAMAEAARRIPAANVEDIVEVDWTRCDVRLLRFLGVWGNVTIEELAKIALIAQMARPRRVLEIGTFNGMTTLHLSANAPASRIYTLDLPPDQPMERPDAGLDAYVYDALVGRENREVGAYYREAGCANVVQLFGNSRLFDLSSAIDGPIDLAFIDGGHDYETVRSDTEKVLQVLAPGGIVLWHNYADICCPDVTTYLLELSAERPVRHLRNTMLAAYRATGFRPS